MSIDMELSIKDDNQALVMTEADASVLLLDTPDNKGEDFLQLLQKQGVKFNSERVNDKEDLFNILKKSTWDILLVCDQVSIPVREETQVFMEQLGCESAYVLLSTSEITIDLLTDSYQRGFSQVLSSHHPDYSLEVFVRAIVRSRNNYRLSQLNQEKFNLRRHCEQLVSGTDEALAYLQDGIHVHSNTAYLTLLGYESSDDLVVTPFIDVIAPEQQEKIKQELMAFQQKLAKKSDTDDLQIEELALQGIGEQEGIFQVSAVFKSAVYDGEECLQVVMKGNTGQDQEEPVTVMQMLEYPQFYAQLESLVKDAKETKSQMGYVLHVAVSGIENYIMENGFQSLDERFINLSSALKAVIPETDLLSRFSENSFVIFIKEESVSSAQEHIHIKAVTTLVEDFGAMLRKELSDDSAKEIKPLVTVTPIDEKIESPQKVIESFLLGSSGAIKNTQSASINNVDNVVPFVEKNAKENEIKAKESADIEAEVSPDDRAGAADSDNIMDDDINAESEVGSVNEPSEQDVPGEPQVSGDDSSTSIFDQKQLNDAMTGNSFNLFCETVISVQDIETEFYDIAMHLDDKPERITQNNIERAVCNTPLAHKMDMLALNNAVSVVSEFYKKGQEYRLYIPFSLRSLTENKLVEMIEKETANLNFPAGMITLDFSIRDITEDLSSSISQFEKLSDAGIFLSISDVLEVDALEEILTNSKIYLVKLHESLIAQAANDEKHLDLLSSSVDKLHKKNIKVIAGNISSNELLNICCKANIDLVKGEYIQNSPMPLNEDAMAQEMLI